MTLIARIKRPAVIIPSLIALILIGLLYSLSQKDMAPDVTFTTLQGEQIPMQSLRGKVLLVNFWATTCSGCIEEMPDLIQTYNTLHPKGLEIVAVAMSYDPPSQVLTYATRQKLPFPVMHDGFDEMATRFKDVRLTPTTFVVNKQGQIIRQIIGAVDAKDLQKTLEAALHNP